MSNDLEKQFETINDTIENDEPLRVVLRYIVALIGIKLDKLDKLEVEVILNFLKNNYFKLGLNELKEAFDLGVRGLLDVDLIHYQSFNTLYVTNVIASYKRYKNQNRKPKVLDTAPVPLLTFDEARAHTKETFEKYKNKEDLKDIKWTDIYYHLREEKKISFTPIQIKAHQDKVTKDLTKERQILRSKGKSTVYIDLTFQWVEMFYCECRKRAVLHYFLKEQF